MSSVLFLQGPLGPYFARLARRFSRQGITTHRINFNGGDRYYGWADRQVDYRDRTGDWPTFLHDYLCERDIRAVFVYGDCRFYHRVAREVCEQLGVAFWAFEEGYLRPDFVTLERGGVNAHSGTDWSQGAIDSYRAAGRQPAPQVGPTFWQRAWFASLYYAMARLAKSRFPHYRHHRSRRWKEEGLCWLTSFYRKGLYRVTEWKLLPRLIKDHHRQFFLFPLQTCDDFQIRVHADLLSIEHSIDLVISSFAANAAPAEKLVIKHHPMDRGFCHYGELIDILAAQRGAAGRVTYCHDLHLPTLLAHAKGVVTINSTVGISALLHRVPTKVLGRALYDIPGLTHQGDLAGFWRHPDAVDGELFRRFRPYLHEHTQLDGCFYKCIEQTVEAAWQKVASTLEVPVEGGSHTAGTLSSSA
ncbi:capsule biosynthesis protein [Microbulbifer rhizosphaerae]|uniref:Capsular polysaccharide export protein n=1 Tax=Microbulbifer rhizosphaerae TaxID=1562603 RepID=A0A7W4WCT1_9GAMM|nr:capsular biosynthesis protein [Microbulbifer rhizosphaerae]MBB3061876.1 capsular polysaccharide export protein [Microbulbifer rhizosphaerae]